MLGKPKFKKDDRVEYQIKDTVYKGYIYIVDAYGTFEYTKDVSYDIMVDSGDKQGLHKHIPEKYIRAEVDDL